MNEDSNKLLENLMGMLGDNPTETIGQMLSALQSNDRERQDENLEKENHNTENQLNFDPSMLLKIQSLMGELSTNESDERSSLLAALRPFLSETKRPQVDQAIKFLKLAKLAKTAQDMDLFKGLL